MVRVTSLLALVAAASVSARDVRASDDELSVIGLAVAAGVPDGATASIVVRPWSFLRVHGGVAHNLISTGVQGGASLIIFDAWLTNTLTVEGGWYPEGDANSLVQRIAGPDFPANTLLARVSYVWANAHFGFEFGQEYVTFAVHVGMTYLSTKFGAGSEELAGTTIRFTESPSIRGWVPSAKVGLTVYLF